LKNETKQEDMADILEEYKRYVPSNTVTLDEQIPKEDVTEHHYAGGWGLPIGSKSKGVEQNGKSEQKKLMSL
jgi:hypothetical protein